MSDLNELFSGSPDEWLRALPGYQAQGVAQLLRQRTPEEAAISWMSGAGSNDTAPFGGVKNAASLLYQNVLIEIRKLLCGDRSYQEERQQVLALAGAGKTAIVAAISVAIGPHLGTAAVFIAPVVAIILSIVARASTSTVCEAMADLIQGQGDS